MPRKAILGAAGVSGDITIAPSSRDWDYTFDGGGEWPVAGNSLGDHTDGAYIDNTGGDSGISSLHTFSGEFTIQFTVTGINNATFGVHEITEDSKRSTEQNLGMRAASTESFLYQEGGLTAFFYGSTNEATVVIAAGSVVQIVRDVLGNITVLDDDVLIHTFASTSVNPMRFFIGASGSPFDQNFDNLTYTVPSDNIHLEGFLNSDDTTGSWGGSTSSQVIGSLQAATSSGTVETAEIKVAIHTTTFNAHAEIWTHDGTNPLAQVGTDSDTISINAVQNFVFTFSDVTLEKGTKYWFLIIDEGSTGRVEIGIRGTKLAPLGTGRATTIAGISDSLTWSVASEMTITPTGEPTPDHDTLLLIHSDTTDGSTTFTDSSQFVRTVTRFGDTDHETAQQKFGATSIAFDGTGDYLSIADSDDFYFTRDFTVDMFIRVPNVSGTKDIITQGSGASWSNMSFLLALSGAVVNFQGSNNGSSGVNISTGSVISANTWHHIAVIKNGQNFDIYVDGTSQASTTSSLTMVNSTYDLLIGKDPTVAPRYIGHMDEIRISRVARWDANFTPPTAPYP